MMIEEQQFKALLITHTKQTTTSNEELLSRGHKMAAHRGDGGCASGG